MSVQPTFRRDKDMLKADRAWKSGMAVLRSWIKQQPFSSWKDFLQMQEGLPDLPKRLLDSYAETYHSVTPPPLRELCPVDFEMQHWSSFVQELDRWEPDEANFSSGWPKPIISDTFHGVLSAMIDLAGCSDKEGSVTPFCHPESLYFNCRSDCYEANPKFRLVGVVAKDIDHDPDTLKLHVARLYSYMLLTDTFVGLISSYNTTFACKRTPGIVWVSQGISHKSGQALKACAFARWLADNTAALGQQPFMADASMPNVGHLAQSSSAIFDRSLIIARLRLLGKEMSVANMDDLIAKLAWLGDVRERVAEMCYLSHSEERIAATGVCDDKAVIVKSRDLTQSRYVDVDSCLRKFLREVDVYARLRSLQGEVIPELLEYGFVRGAMVCYLVFADHGRTLRREINSMVDPKDYEAESTLVKVSLEKMHGFGVHYGGSPLWLKSDVGNAVILISFSGCSVDGDRNGMVKDMERVTQTYQPNLCVEWFGLMGGCLVRTVRNDFYGTDSDSEQSS